ncbi:NHL repeat-containing protein [Lacrimispora algidixylanolytica]|uniref:CDP-Glycerol:Poly(Glycerophosphate) glycerophosphotransferase n=1 Tax=Lacrimispora algidixylanolytica TaxID=94868 RepID=A0A419TCQ3_9FIRM|nr:hypothetical protein [Lacrimispora algidixylanolytica]RKD35263.1 hypothetical protein BET01_02660 [Lacrimispora algidixylanolytica]
MRTFIRKQLIELLDSMKQLQNELPTITGKGKIIQLLADCQEAAIAIGETLERETSDYEQIVSILESYSEEAFHLSETQEEMISKQMLFVLDELTDKVNLLLTEIIPVYHVVFLPYKASMWDSLESIWLAAKEDKRCECYVVPIPYYEFDSMSNRWIEHYDGDEFPEYVPVVHYRDYSLEQNLPNIAYVHNPYDACNMITRVDMRFFSEELKRYVSKLVYVPYYVTGGFIAKEHLGLPVYQHMDYMIVQSEYAKSFCMGMPYYDKILPLGSPKLDRVINLCRNGSKMPGEWQPMLNGKKVLMLNTSIGCFLQEGDKYFQKIKKICQVIKNQDQVAIIWRPHPLLEATIKSMRPNLLEDYNKLKAYFTENKIGILDETSDISRAVAISDGYIGEESTSVVNLFGATGKPIFILNNYIADSFTKEERSRVRITDALKQEDKLWLGTNHINALFYMDVDTKQVHYAGRVENQPKWYGTYPFFTEVEDKLYLSPSFAGCPAIFDLNSFEQKLIRWKDTEKLAGFSQIVSWKDRIFYFPSIGDSIAEYHIKTGEWKYHTECLEMLWKEVGKEDAEKQGLTFRCSVCGNDIWVSAAYTNYVLRLNMEDGTYALCPVGEKENGYSGIIAEERYIWLAEVNSGNIIRWDRRSGKTKIYSVPEGFRTWPGTILGRRLPHVSLIDMGKWIVTIPGFSNCMIKLDKITGKTSLLLKSFWNKAEKEVNGYSPNQFLTSEFGARWDENKLIVQRNCDEAVAIINVDDGTWDMFYPTLNKADYSKMIDGEDGFEKREKKSGFFRRESKIFSLEGFIDDLVHDRLTGVRERQLKELSTLAANLDGTCGIKVHEHMMNVLDNCE